MCNILVIYYFRFVSSFFPEIVQLKFHFIMCVLYLLRKLSGPALLDKGYSKHAKPPKYLL